MKKLIFIIITLIGISPVNAGSNEPKFNQIKRSDVEIQKAHSLALSTINGFINQVKSGGNQAYMAKLRFRDPDLSEQLGEDQFLYLWLNEVVYHPEDKLLSGVFFEVPDSLKEWHQVGQRLGFVPEDVFDWMVNDNGKVEGGFTIRVTRSRLTSEEEKTRYDEYIGISSYEPIPE